MNKKEFKTYKCICGKRIKTKKFKQHILTEKHISYVENCFPLSKYQLPHWRLLTSDKSLIVNLRRVRKYMDLVYDNCDCEYECICPKLFVPDTDHFQICDCIGEICYCGYDENYNDVRNKLINSALEEPKSDFSLFVSRFV
jgi:hypothetical protein